MQVAWVISVGTELTLGQTVDTNAPWLARQLASLGMRTTRHVCVPDELDVIRETLLAAAETADVVLVSGGLGPTEDDLTRQALAAAGGVGLKLDPASAAHLRSFFAARGRQMPERNVIQAMIPQGGRALPNTCGTAPGLFVTLRGTPCYAIPGVPFEMREMYEREVAPVLAAAARGAVLLSRRLSTFGLGESDIAVKIGDLMERGRNPEVGTTASFGVVGVRINACGATRQEAESLLAEAEAELRARLGDAIFGVDGQTLGSVVGELLVGRGGSLSTAESCTGGMIGALLTDVPGSSGYYVGGVVCYSNAAKTALLEVGEGLLEAHGAVSEPVAALMASGARRIFGSDFALSVTGIAGPAGGSEAKPVGLVYVGLASPDDTHVREYRFGPDSPREAIRQRAAHAALDVLRRRLLG